MMPKNEPIQRRKMLLILPALEEISDFFLGMPHVSLEIKINKRCIP